MKRILVSSDSHGNIEYIRREIERVEKIDLIVHLGDYIRDAQMLRREFKNYDFEIVKGNCDAYADGEREKLFEICGKKIFITHGDKYGVKTSYDNIIYRAAELEADCVLFGHTHMAQIFKEGSALFLNPGAAKNKSIGIIEIEDDIKGCVLEVV